MDAVHELREEYRIYRIEHPQYRWLFLIVDLASLLIKLALFGGFMVLCWYIVSRSPQSEPIAGVLTKAESPAETSAFESPELTSERIALLRRIAGDEVATDQNAASLVGLVPTASTRASGQPINDTTDDSIVVAAIDTPSIKPEVQVESLTNGSSSPVFQKQFADNVYVSASTKNGNWVLDQNASDYTVQLALTVNVEFLVEFARQLPDEFVAAIYPERNNSRGEIQYSLSAGSFASKRDAEAALVSLPEKTKRYGAHVRAFDEIQANTSEFLR